ncbi:MAG: DUF362 domain-containing protein [Clostridiales bacterium]|nr:DUF362 domain-containing protein [Clostridiales bacterium]
MKHIVALIPLNTYEQPLVDAAVRQGVELLGGLRQFVNPEEKIVLKPNLLARALPQKAITTHPAVFQAVCRLLREEGFQHLSYGDSPGNPTTTPDRAAEGAGIAEAAARYGVEKADFTSGSVVPFPQGRTAKSFYLCKGVQDADALINVCKMKTHALERITGAVKNLYGCVTGVNKATGHAAYPNSDVFADMLADLSLCIRPRLHIMDGVVAMEGNGPTSGTPVNMNVLLLSADPVALDAVFATLIHLDPAAVPTCVSGAKAALGVMDASSIEVVTPEGSLTLQEAQARYGKADFDVFRGVIKKGFLFNFMPLLPFLQHRPRVDHQKCVACGVCEEACPVPEKAVHSGHGHKARYDYKKCIRCYCCQEMCPVKAIEVYRHPLTKLLSGK